MKSLPETSQLPANLFDFTIVGLGPTGAVLACLLGQHGKRVLVLEKELVPYDKPRAIGIDHESMRTLQFCGIAHEFAPLTFPFRGSQFLGVDGEVIQRLDPLPQPYPLAWPANATFVQPKLEAMLRARIAQLPNVTVRLAHTLTGITECPDSIRLTIENRDTAFTDETRYLIGCDGARSIVRQYLGVAVDDLAFDEWWVVLDARIRDESKTPVSNRQYCRPSRPGTYVRGPGDLRRWEMKLLPHEDPDDFKKKEKIVSALKDFIDPSAVDIWRSAVYRFHAITARTWQRGPIFLAGDAAHQTPPFLGQGMNSGFRDATNLAWKLLMVEECGVAPALLQTYEQERKPHFDTVVGHAKALGLIIGELDVEKAIQRDVRMRDQLQRKVSPTVRQSFIPNLTTGVLYRDALDRPAAMAGELFVQPGVRSTDGRNGLFDDFVGMAFVLVTTSSEVQSWLGADNEDFWKRIGGRRVIIGAAVDGLAIRDDFLHFSESGTVFNDWMQKNGFAAVIARPDRYVFGGARSEMDVADMIAQLRNLLEPSVKLKVAAGYN